MKFSHKLALAMLALLAVVLNAGAAWLVRSSFDSQLEAAQRQNEAHHQRDAYGVKMALIEAGAGPYDTDLLKEYGQRLQSYGGQVFQRHQFQKGLPGVFRRRAGRFPLKGLPAFAPAAQQALPLVELAHEPVFPRRRAQREVGGRARPGLGKQLPVIAPAHHPGQGHAARRQRQHQKPEPGAFQPSSHLPASFRSNRTVVPLPTSLSMASSPPWSLAMRAQRARPNPLPFCARARERSTI